MTEFFSALLHIDQSLTLWVQHYGAWIYLILFCIIFGETGLVVLPFLPGDSLLFIVGALCASGQIAFGTMAALLVFAAILGNSVNYTVGRSIGPRVFTSRTRLLDRTALLRTHQFFERHGGKTVVLSRFLPILRTFAPFVAGVGTMPILRFQMYNVAGALLWVLGLMTAGYFFGNLPWVRAHLNTIVLIGLAAALGPVLLGVCVKLYRRGR